MAADPPLIRSSSRNLVKVKSITALVILVRAIGRAFRWLLLVAEDGCHRDVDEHPSLELPVRPGCLLVTDGRRRTGGPLAVGWFRPCGDLPQLPGDDLEGARNRDGKQRRHEAAEEAAEP